MDAFEPGFGMARRFVLGKAEQGFPARRVVNLAVVEPPVPDADAAALQGDLEALLAGQQLPAFLGQPLGGLIELPPQATERVDAGETAAGRGVPSPSRRSTLPSLSARQENTA